MGHGQQAHEGDDPSNTARDAAHAYVSQYWDTLPAAVRARIVGIIITWKLTAPPSLETALRWWREESGITGAAESAIVIGRRRRRTWRVVDEDAAPV